VDRFASCSADKTVKIWELRSASPVHCFDGCHTDQITAIAFAPDASDLVSVSDDHSMQFYKI
jgi:WD40 repeat protein